MEVQTFMVRSFSVWVLAAASLSVIACSVGTTSTEGSPSNAASSSSGSGASSLPCPERCSALGKKCGISIECAELCAQSNGSEVLACAEQKNCDDAAMEACAKKDDGTSSSGSPSSSSGNTSSGGASSSSSSGGSKPVLKEGAKCACDDSSALMCQSTDGPCESSLTCLSNVCIDKKKTCSKDADCQSGYQCIEYLVGTSSLGTYCTKK